MVYQLKTSILDGNLNREIHEFQELNSPASDKMVNIVRGGWNLRINSEYFDKVMVSGSYSWTAYTMNKKLIKSLQTELDDNALKTLNKLKSRVDLSINKIGPNGWGQSKSIIDSVDEINEDQVGAVFTPMMIDLETKEVGVGEREVTTVISDDVAGDLIEMHSERPIETVKPRKKRSKPAPTEPVACDNNIIEEED